MPQIAQQDYLVIKQSELTQEKATELAKRGVLLDVIVFINDNPGIQSRIVNFVMNNGLVTSCSTVNQEGVYYIKY